MPIALRVAVSDALCDCDLLSEALGVADCVCVLVPDRLAVAVADAVADAVGEALALGVTVNDGVCVSVVLAVDDPEREPDSEAVRVALGVELVLPEIDTV